MEECDDSEYVETSSSNKESPVAKTGLAQSNTSLDTPPYCYTNQQGYDSGCYGYSLHNSDYNDYTITGGLLPKHNIEDTRPKITAAVYKSSLKRSPSTEDLHLASIEGPMLEKVLMQSSIEEITKIEQIEAEVVVDTSQHNDIDWTSVLLSL